MGGRTAGTSELRVALIALLVLGNATASFVILRGHSDAELRGWDCSYPLLIGNELSEDRPWLGRIRGLAIYDRALAADEVLELQGLPFAGMGVAVRRRMGGLAAFDFSQPASQRVRQLLPGGPALDLRLPPADGGAWQLTDRALELRKPLLIRSTSAPRAICQAVMRSQAFAVEAEIASASSDNRGPARIVSQSASPLQRDFTLGQDGDALVFRVRTPWNGPNGMRAQLTATHAMPDQSWHHAVAVYLRGATTLFLDGRQRALTIRYYELMWLGESTVVPLAGFLGIGFVALGAVMTLLTAGLSWPARLPCLYLGAALIPTAAGLVLGFELGHDPDRWLIVAAILGPPIGLVITHAWPWLAARRAPGSG